MNSKTALEEVYKTHHMTKGRYGYLFCHGKRAPYLKKWIGAGKKVLDVGCRDGMLTEHFAKGNDVTGVDIDQHALSLIQKRLGIQTLWLDVNEEWPFEKNTYDVIVACEIMEHLFYLPSFLQKVTATLKEGGLFLGSVPNAFRMRNRLKFLQGKPFENDPTHVRMFSYDTLQSLLKSHFSTVEIVPLQGKILPFLPVSDHMPLFLNRLFGRDLLFKSTK